MEYNIKYATQLRTGLFKDIQKKIINNLEQKSARYLLCNSVNFKVLLSFEPLMIHIISLNMKLIMNFDN